MSQPDYIPERIPVGSYVFRVLSESEREKGTSAAGRAWMKITYKFKAVNENGSQFPHMESFFGGQEKYGDLLLAMGGTPNPDGTISGRDIDATGKQFRANIIMEEDRKDPMKSWPRMDNIRSLDEGSVPDSDTDDDIPF